MYTNSHHVATVSDKLSLATFNEQIRTIKVNRARRIDHNQVREYDAKRKQLENEVARSKVYVT